MIKKNDITCRVVVSVSVSVSDAVTADFTAVEECEDDDDNNNVEHGGGVVVGSVVVPAKRTIFSGGV